MFGPHGGPNPDFGFGPPKWSGPCRASSFVTFFFLMIDTLSPVTQVICIVYAPVSIHNSNIVW